MPVHKLKPSKLAIWRGIFAVSSLWFLMHEPLTRIITKDSVSDVTQSFAPDNTEVAVRTAGVSFSLLSATETSDTPRIKPTPQTEELEQASKELELQALEPQAREPRTLDQQKQELKEPKRTQPVTGQTALKEVTKETAEGVASEVAVSETSPEIVTPKQEPTEEQANPTTALSDAANAVAASIPVAVSTPAFLEPPQAPHYSRSMRSRGLGGVVIVEVLIGAKGNQTELEIAKSSGLPALDQSALSAVRKWRFKPHAVNGINVASRVHIPVRFAIN